MKLQSIISMVTVFCFIALGSLITQRPAQAATTIKSPTQGYTLHIDANKHFGDAHPSEIAHHWCKVISTDLIECQLYDGDGPHARLVGVETIVPASVWKTFSPTEQKLWHLHKVELQKVHATLPGLSKAEQAKVIKMILPTYGKVWILWNPAVSKEPTGSPFISVLH